MIYKEWYIYLVERSKKERKTNRLEREKIYTLCTPPPPPRTPEGGFDTRLSLAAAARFLLLFLHLFLFWTSKDVSFFLDTTTVKSVFSKRSSSTREDFSLSCECIACACHKSSVSSLFLCFSALCVRLMMMMQCGFFSRTCHTLKEIERRPAPCSRVGICIFLSPFLSLYVRPPTHNDAFSSNLTCFFFDCASLF